MIARRRGVARRAVGLAAGTAVMAGTAGAVRHHQDQKYAAQDAAAQQQALEQEELAQYRAQQAAATAPAPAPAQAGTGQDLNSQLMQLAKLHDSGVLNDEEFAQAKAKLLAGG